MNRILFTFLSLITCAISLAQPTPYSGSLLFNLKDEKDNMITIDDIQKGKVQILSYDNENSIEYDTIHKAFSFRSKGFETRSFTILYKNDTIQINYPSVRTISAVFIKSPILLNGKNYSFSNKYIYDSMHSNHYNNCFAIFNLCEGCFISEYEMPNEQRKLDTKPLFKVKFK